LRENKNDSIEKPGSSAKNKKQIIIDYQQPENPHRGLSPTPE